LPVPENRYPSLNLSPQRQRQKTLETIVAILLELAERQPILFIVEDLHWTDPSTLELLNLVIDQTPTASLLTVLMCRPHFQPAWHHRSYLTEITVRRLSQPQIARMTTDLAGGNPLPGQVLASIMEKTDGVPLFVEELTKAVLEAGMLQDVDGHYALTGSFSTFAIPATLHDSLMARLDRLDTAKAVAQYAAVIGRQFAYALLQAVLPLDDATLQGELGKLVEAEIVYQRGLPPHATYLFKHALIQDAAYQSLLKSTRQQYHQRIAQVFEGQFSEAAATQPELLAHHYTEAGLNAQGVPYWQRAGQYAIERSACLEAIAHLTKGLEVLRTLPDTPKRAQQELDIQIALGKALSAARGYGAPEVEAAYTRAYELGQHVGDAPELLPVLWGLWYFTLGRAEFGRAQTLGEHLLLVGQSAYDPILQLPGHTAMGITRLFLGEVAQASRHLEQSVTLYDLQQHQALAFLYGMDCGILGRALLGMQRLVQGYPSQGLQHSMEALRLAQAVTHPYTLASILIDAALIHWWRREVQPAQEQGEALIALASAQGFTLRAAHGALVHGWTRVMQGEADGGLTQMRQALSAIRVTGAAVTQSLFLGMFADACGYTGQIEVGLHALDEALAHVATTGERVWEAELHRLKGELLSQHATGQEAAETCCQQALTVSQGQGARWLELRAAMSLARLWQSQGKRAEARELLAPIYSWFTEGFDTADLQEAKALLEALA
jgi:predicted ATPase